MKIFLILTCLVSFAACDQKGSVEGTHQRSKAEEETKIDLQNENLKSKSEKMELDLQNRNRFYKGVSGEFTGAFSVNNSSFKILVSMNPSIHVMEPNRVRSLEEIQDDLNNLSLISQVSVTDAKDNVGIGGCVYDKTKADINTGKIQFASSECPLRYVISLSNNVNQSKDLSLKLFSGEETKIQTLHLQAYSKYGSNYTAVLRRKQ
ncbi:MAG: hypothetical protein IPM57_08720 [Oligoflexia bacterium]|nr:hypothetical protein [Oligoflexia bacterium]